MTSNIPHARDQLREALECLKVDNVDDVFWYVEDALSHMGREYNGRVPPHSAKMTPKTAQSIRKMKAMFPEKSQQEIADAHNVNPGRVSEALRYK